MRDAATIVAQNQDLTNQGVGSVTSLNSYDVGVAGAPPPAFQAIGNITADFGRGKAIYDEVRVTTAFTSGSSTATVQVKLIMADSADLVTGQTVLQETAAILVTALVVGYRLRLGTVPAGVTKRYLGYLFVVAVETVTAGTLWAEFSLSKIDKPV
jgi:hypothetical protein